MANYWKIRQLGPNVITAETRIPNYESAADVYIRLTGGKKKNPTEMYHLMHMEGGTGTTRVYISAPTAVGG